MYFVINNERYRVKRSKKSRYADEYELYNENKFCCIFYQDGRTLEEAVESVVHHLKMSIIISDSLSKLTN
jgi:hypothetical protein